LAKYRTNKIKHEHSMIPGLREHLERVAACPDIHGILPGPIHPKRSAAARDLTLSIQYEIDTGLRCLAKTAQAVQEVRIVTDRPAEVRRWLVEQGLAEDRLPPAPPPQPPRKGPGTPGKQVVLQFDQRCAACGRTVAAGSRAIRVGAPPAWEYLHVRCFRSR